MNTDDALRAGHLATELASAKIALRMAKEATELTIYTERYVEGYMRGRVQIIAGYPGFEDVRKVVIANIEGQIEEREAELRKLGVEVECPASA